jgi:epoxyqueuosine reductase
VTAGPARQALFRALEAHGHKGGLVPIERLRAIRREFESMRECGATHPDLSSKWLSVFRFEPPAEVPDARSVIVTATPRPPSRFTFDLGAGQLTALVPPSYQHGVRDRDRVQGVAAAALRPWGFTIAEANLPKKRLAAESGMARYGRNNITYVRGMGSYLRLDAFFSDLPCERDSWIEPQLMERCRTCAACRESCPTGAIPNDRFLLRAELCIPFHNEEPNDVPFPDWLERSVHHCLVGCMRCQTVCPENAERLGCVVEAERFGREETELLARGVPLVKLPPETAEKLERSDLAGLMDCLSRNLRTLIENATRHRQARAGPQRAQGGQK